ncbi:hypothetical protein RhiirA5_422267 [Rhizophagus irregularis]|uniref:F-box domain-containing protein n=3 Tax=Rhizophagus irregularis TaxID=588596 RepID=U9UI47_RHIID|nr:hypothetical protein GLOIN_2v1768717 [Rhizophagus irregularis DAOM 181602=DAOM 197198]EXX73004.1 hypothetical protein RirG_064100 [Rhizophagus irregularis DAOM 197198w]PKC04425.1 hypothetical protein RhiirA5_422267 [Rhizophagus irregularis]PKC67694.1 hypothetical protein RhiirA1_509007 [Rhizophagus irregularis]PKY19773.1 hypothetical protein RhiirB3_495685 [Rhizophagus irregularis]POG76595.1 hypothetical protein GLOIN_2v1768717 [Rhizophagus irregularis DAOM 181602=DAOM 197198]|eukprot:XP_025183461.1 hypothetical protein GLOIN_2v1768717 [Rhizophagus irregularis DAOM 181602=DAOM 197198]
MTSELNYDCLQNIFKIFEYNNDQDILFKCILVNRSWCESAIPYLWKDPFSIVRKRENSRKLLTTIISMFPFDKIIEEKLKLYEYELIHLNYKQSFYNYLNFCRIFKFAEFYGFVDKCAHAVTSKNVGKVSSILCISIYKIIFENCTEIRKIRISSLPKIIIKNQNFNNLSNLQELEICNFTTVKFFEKLVHVCKKIKKIRIITNAFNNSKELVNLFKVQQNLKIIHFLNDLNQCQIITEELSTQILSNIEELIMKNFMFVQIKTLSNLKRLEFTFTLCSPQIVATFRNVTCPLLEVLKFHRDFPPLNVLAEFIEKTEGHLQCFYLESYSSMYPYPIYQNSDTQVLLRSIAKSCPKIKSLTTIFKLTEDLSFLKYLLSSCNELESLTLTNIEPIRNDEIIDDCETISKKLEKQLRIDGNWNVKHEMIEYTLYTLYRFFIEKA